MAKILILGVKVPFTFGGQDALVGTLGQELKKRGHQVDLIELPFQVHPKEGLLKQAALWRTLDLENFGGSPVDLVIATKFPSYYVKHPRKSVWLVHQHRPIYELYGSRFSDFSDDPRDEALRKLLMSGDEKVLSEARYVSGISRNVIERLKHYNGINGEVLYPPLPLGSRYYCVSNGSVSNGPTNVAEPYLLSVNRICSIKRVDLIIKSLPQVHNFIKLKVVGTPDESGIMDYLKNEIAKHHLGERVEFLGRVDDASLLDLYAHCLAVCYTPFNEDYGYITLEAMASGKPLLTTNDSGGVLEFAKDGENALVTEATCEALSRAVNRLAEDPNLAASLGQQGRAFIEKSGLLDQDWERIVSRLLSPLGDPIPELLVN